MSKRYRIVDGHLDLSMNALEWNRDLRWSVEEIRESEKEMTDKPDRGRGTVSFGEMRRGNVQLCVATQIARYVKKGSPVPGWNSQEQAWAHTQGQLAWYKCMEEAGEMRPVRNKSELENHLSDWNSGRKDLPVGYVLSLEGADSILSIDHLNRAYEYGLRAVGPAHFGPGIYAWGTSYTGPLTARGRELIKKIDSLGMILDVTHLSDESYREALDLFHGPVWASHNNCRIFCEHPRQFTDDQIRELVERDAVIGAALDNWMLVPGWDQGKTGQKGLKVSLELVINNIDHICQTAGDSEHSAIGSDLDGAFGTEQSPSEINTIADLQLIASLLEKRGYKETDIMNIMSENWIRFLRKNLPG
ncbi:MAG TPA: membrane dipeptidase [Bacteroidales bacterium]|nr:membrane dipeptidase [Bacteroidales bacterium]